MSQRYIIPSLDRSVQVLGLLAREPKGLTLADLSRLTDVPKSTLFRILTTLQHHHFVQWSEQDRCFRLGYYLWELGSSYVDRCEPARFADRHMKRLSEATGETIFLAKLEDDLVVYLRRVDGTKPLAMMRNLSQSTPAYCTASGRAILAFLSMEEMNAILDRQQIVKHTERTVTDRMALLESLAHVRRLGYSQVDAEYNKELLYLSAPVFDYNGRPCAALTLAMLSSQRLQAGLVQKYTTLLKDSAAAFSRDMGYVESKAA